MNLMMNPSFTNEIAAQRRQVLIEAADRHRTRRWFKSAKTAGGVRQTPTTSTTTPTNVADIVSSAAVARKRVTTHKELEHASARVAC